MGTDIEICIPQDRDWLRRRDHEDFLPGEEQRVGYNTGRRKKLHGIISLEPSLVGKKQES